MDDNRIHVVVSKDVSFDQTGSIICSNEINWIYNSLQSDGEEADLETERETKGDSEYEEINDPQVDASTGEGEDTDEV